MALAITENVMATGINLLLLLLVEIQPWDYHGWNRIKKDVNNLLTWPIFVGLLAKTWFIICTSSHFSENLRMSYLITRGQAVFIV